MTPALSNTSNPPFVRLGRIRFINVDPIYYGFEQERLSDDIEIYSAPPVELNQMMATGKLDISSVSSAAFGLHHKDWLLLPGISIACSGNVMSVLLVSRMPLERLNGRRVMVSDESATAVRLMRLMFSHKGISPLLETRKVHDPSQIDPDAMAALVIGDASLRHNWRDSFEYVWDLGDLWASHASLPFVFAVWAVRKDFAATYPERVLKATELLHKSKRMGLSNIDAVARSAASKLNIPLDTTDRYFKNFCFDLNAPEKAGLEAFFNDLYTTGIFPEKIPIRFFEG